MAEINYKTEKSWVIKEQYPIKAKRTETSNGIKLEFKPMTISYKTFEKIFTSTDSGALSYNYIDGECYIQIYFRDLYGWDNEENFLKEFGEILEFV